MHEYCIGIFVVEDDRIGKERHRIKSFNGRISLDIYQRREKNDDQVIKRIL